MLELGTIIKKTSPKSIEISLSGKTWESKEKDVTYYQVEGSRKRNRYGYTYLEYKMFNLTKSKYEYIEEIMIKTGLASGKIEIIENV